MLAEHTVGSRKLDWRGSQGLESLDCIGKHGHKYIMPANVMSDLAPRTIIQSTTRKPCMDNQ